MNLDFGGKSRIFVTGIGKQAGSTTTAILLAKYLADEGEKVAYVQLTEGLEPYYYLALDKKEEWKSFYKSNSLRNICNMMQKVNWAVRLPEDPKLTEEKRRMLLNQVPGKVLVCDTNTGLEDADMIIAVVDPLPSKILQNIDRIKALKRMEYEGYRVVWLLNKMNKGVSMAQIKKSLKLENYLAVEFVNQEEIYHNEYEGSGLLSSKKLKENFIAAFSKLFK